MHGGDRQDQGKLVAFSIVVLESLQAFHDLVTCMVETGKIKANWLHSP
jgi:hypothetical protein